MADNIPYKELLEHLAEGVYFVNQDRQILFWNQAAAAITGYAKEEILGRHCWDNILVHVDERGTCLCGSMCPLLTAITQKTHQEKQVYLRHKQGHRVPVFVRAVPLFDVDGQTIGAVELFGDNSAVLAASEQLKKLESLALLDPLTGISNRRHVEMLLTGSLEQKSRYDTTVGLIFLDVDNFKKVNDTYGHGLGDEILKMVARGLKHGTRLFDTPCRWGGEEFVVLCEKVDSAELSVIAERLRMLIANSCIPHDSSTVGVTVSLGATLARADDTMASFIQRADALMYQSKINGKNRVTTG